MAGDISTTSNVSTQSCQIYVTSASLEVANRTHLPKDAAMKLNSMEQMALHSPARKLGTIEAHTLTVMLGSNPSCFLRLSSRA
jgi:hypothetical protein